MGPRKLIRRRRKSYLEDCCQDELDDVYEVEDVDVG